MLYMKKDFKKIKLLKINWKKIIFKSKYCETFTEICQKLKLNSKRNVANMLF